MMAAMLYPERGARVWRRRLHDDSQEWTTAVRLKLKPRCPDLEDSAYGMIRWKQAVDHFPDFGLTFGNPDFANTAESYGAKGSKGESTDDLIPTLHQERRGALISVPIDSREYARCWSMSFARS